MSWDGCDGLERQPAKHKNVNKIRLPHRLFTDTIPGIAEHLIALFGILCVICALFYLFASTEVAQYAPFLHPALRVCHVHLSRTAAQKRSVQAQEDTLRSAHPRCHTFVFLILPCSSINKAWRTETRTGGHRNQNGRTEPRTGGQGAQASTSKLEQARPRHANEKTNERGEANAAPTSVSPRKLTKNTLFDSHMRAHGHRKRRDFY